MYWELQKIVINLLTIVNEGFELEFCYVYFPFNFLKNSKQPSSVRPCLIKIRLAYKQIHLEFILKMKYILIKYKSNSLVIHGDEEKPTK